jgi:hypothetical protein
MLWALSLCPQIHAQQLSKPQVSDLIRRVENGVDEFQNYLNRRTDNAKTNLSSPGAQEAKANTQARRSQRGAQQPSAQNRASATATANDLNDALDDLNKSTNRLRRKFDMTENWLQTKVQVDRVLDDGRKINTVVAKGNYGSEVARLWGALRTQINQLARAYGATPLGV